MPYRQWQSFSVAELRDSPAFLDVVADRLWRVWWKESGYPLEYIIDRLEESLKPEAFPFTLVAFRDSTFLGTASVVASHKPESQHYSPWIANVWVEENCRNRGVGSTLINQAARRTFSLGIERLYLTTRPDKRTFYEKNGWLCIRDSLGADRLVILTRVAEADAVMEC